MSAVESDLQVDRVGLDREPSDLDLEFNCREEGVGRLGLGFLDLELSPDLSKGLYDCDQMDTQGCVDLGIVLTLEDKLLRLFMVTSLL